MKEDVHCWMEKIARSAQSDSIFCRQFYAAPGCF